MICPASPERRMNRRQFVTKFAMGTIAIGVPLTVSATTSAPWLDSPPVIGRPSCRHDSTHCKVIGIGGAGRNLISAMRSSGALDGKFPNTRFAVVDSCAVSQGYVEAMNKATPEHMPTEMLSIAAYGADRPVNAAGTASPQIRDALSAVLSDADLVILIAGLKDGGTGNYVTPTLAGMARAAGAMTVVIAVTPFDLGWSNKAADRALKRLHQNADQVIRFSNQALGEEFGDHTTLEDLFAIQERRVIATVRRLTQV